MKILLIYPYVQEKRIHEEDISIVPMGLYYIGAMLLQHGHQVRILNGFGLSAKKEKIKEILVSYSPDVVGFSILNANRWGGIEIARMAKDLNPEVSIVFGGIGATYLWNHFLTNFDLIDYVVLGEGEYTFLELINCLKTGHKDQLLRVKGLALRSSGKPVRTPNRKPIGNLDDLIDPARFFTFQHIAITRGCPHNCTFCGSPDFWGRRVRFHSADYFVTQLQRLYQNGVTHFYISDDTFTLKKDLVIDVCQKIIKQGLNISWVAISRVNYVDGEMLGWMRKAGCTQISYGVESGSPKIRHLLGKKFNETQIQEAFKLTLSYGILARAYFIYGAPGETLETISETINIIEKIKPLAAIFYILTLFPGTALYETYEAQSNQSSDIWLNPIEDILYFETDPCLTSEKIIEFGRILRDHYHRSLAGFAKQLELIDLPEFYPLHADFLSRLAMTFSHGDYSVIKDIPDKQETAMHLYQRALAYHPDQRAYLGLGTLYQKEGRFFDSIQILEKGLQLLPDSLPLTMCLGISCMNLGNFKRALSLFEKFPDADEARHFAPICRKNISY